MESRPPISGLLLIRWFCGLFAAGIVVNTVIGIARGRLTFTITRPADSFPVALTTPGAIALGALGWGIIAGVLLTVAAKPRYFRRPLVLVVGALALLAALAGLERLQ